MKALLYILIFHISAISFAQDPRLFENEWYLNKVILDGIDYPSPHNTEIEYVTLRIRPEPYGFDTAICDILDASDVEITNTDIVTSEIVFLPDEPCYIQENNDYQSLYFGFFYVIDPSTQKYQFTYVIEEVEDHLQLTLMNDEGNESIYGDQLLEVPNNNLVEIVLYPNPVKDILTIQSPDVIDQVALYNILGKKLLSVARNFQQIDVTFLPEGIYFATITTAKGKTVRKVVKD
jgi:hypothetical protein